MVSVEIVQEIVNEVDSFTPRYAVLVHINKSLSLNKILVCYLPCYFALALAEQVIIDNESNKFWSKIQPEGTLELIRLVDNNLSVSYQDFPSYRVPH